MINLSKYLLTIIYTGFLVLCFYEIYVLSICNRLNHCSDVYFTTVSKVENSMEVILGFLCVLNFINSFYVFYNLFCLLNERYDMRYGYCMDIISFVLRIWLICIYYAHFNLIPNQYIFAIQIEINLFYSMLGMVVIVWIINFIISGQNNSNDGIIQMV
jgi:hypothetical protein